MWNPHLFLACISRQQSLQPDSVAWGCCLLQLRIYLKGAVFKCQGCDVIPATSTVLFSLQLHNWEKQKPPWQCFTLTCQASHSPSDRELPQGQAQGSLPAMGDICLPASLTCSGPVGRESGKGELSSMVSGILLLQAMELQQGLFLLHIFDIFLGQFCLKLSPWVILLSLTWPEKA